MIRLKRTMYSCALMSVISSPAIAQASDHQQMFDIPAQNLSSALIVFSRQSGVVVAVPSRLAERKMAPQVKGYLNRDMAMRALLSGSGLVFRKGSNQSYVIEEAAKAVPTTTSFLSSGQSAAPAAASTSPASLESPAPEAPQPEIVVTGTRLQSGSFRSPTPVTTIDSAQISQRSAGSAFEVLMDIPSFRATSGPSANSTGAQNASKANLDLRGLGASRTLVLVNGRRHVPDGTGNVWDTNLIPSSLVERADVVTGGASAAYGSDAVAGVVNFVLKNHFEGFTLDLR